jgi:hypothetical protein
MSDNIEGESGVSLSLVLWGLAALLLVLFVVGLSGLIHLAVWTLVIVLVFAICMGAIALIWRAFAG